jgi:hypothetical protein
LHRQELLDEEWIALSRCDHARSSIVGQYALGEGSFDEPKRVFLLERVKGNHTCVWPRVRPRWPKLEQIRTREAKEQDWRACGEARDVLDQVEERGFRPVDVVDDDD